MMHVGGYQKGTRCNARSASDRDCHERYDHCVQVALFWRVEQTFGACRSSEGQQREDVHLHDSDESEAYTIQGPGQLPWRPRSWVSPWWPRLHVLHEVIRGGLHVIARLGHPASARECVRRGGEAAMGTEGRMQQTRRRRLISTHALRHLYSGKPAAPLAIK